MHAKVNLNGKIFDAADAVVAAVSAAALYGKGVFTTIANYGGKPFLWEKHWTRLEHNAAAIGIDIPEYSKTDIIAALDELIEVNQVSNGRARITFLDESPSTSWPFETKQQTSLLITTADFRPMPNNFRLTTSPFQINSASPLAGVKSCNYLEKIMALEETKKRGCDEAVQLNESGQITSACMANLFWTKDGELFTPSLETGSLPGTTREFVIENLECSEVERGIDALTAADSIFLTSAGIAIAQVAEFEGRRMNTVKHGILDLIPSRT